MNQKGFTLIELIIVMMIIAILGVIVIGTISRNKQSNSSIEVFEEAKNETPKISTPLEMTGSIKCLGGHKVIELNGKTYWIGEEPDSWGDLKALPCE